MAKNLVIVGGGPAATNAAETIRQFDEQAIVTLVGDEPAHSRMALPYWLSGQIPREQTYTGDDAYFQRLNVETRIGQRVAKLDDQQHTIQLESGDTIAFDALLLATGSRPVPLAVPGASLPGVHHMWTLADTEHVLAAADGIEQPEVVQIGGGFIGLIVLNAMRKRGWTLTVVEREHQLLPQMLNPQAAALAAKWLTEKEVDVYLGETVQAIEQESSGKKRIVFENGEAITADVVIVGTGVRPNVSLVDGSSVAIDHGILVDHHMRTTVPSIYAAGDVAQGPVLFSDAREVHAVQPTAVDHGRIAGANMAGQDIEYRGSLSMNVLDVCGLQCASFGRWNDESAEAMVIENVNDSIYRCLRWTDDQITGAIYVGQANDMGMLTDVGMTKGLIQTGIHLGEWKQHVRNNPFDVRRAFIAKKVPHVLMQETLLGQPAKARQFRYQDASARHQPNSPHEVYVRAQSRDVQPTWRCTALREVLTSRRNKDLASMMVRIKLMGMLKDRCPADGQLSLPDGGSITDALTALDIPIDSVQVFTVNGALERDKSRVLAADDELTVLPPVGGGFTKFHEWVPYQRRMKRQILPR